MIIKNTGPIFIWGQFSPSDIVVASLFVRASVRPFVRYPILSLFNETV